jgi:TRAP-type C4-dicarboxylate transport system permease large subunit
VTAADTTHLAARILEAANSGMTREQAARFFDGWHEFYLLAGTAAVTLVGLLFVALSFNLDILVHESKAHVLAHARSTLITFSYILVVSLGMLIPNQTALQAGMFLTVSSAIVGMIHIRSLFQRRHRSALPFDRSMRRRSIIFIVAYALALFAGVGMIVTRVPEMLFSLITVICMMLGNAMGVAWDLLVEVGKLKAEGERAGAAQE